MSYPLRLRPNLEAAARERAAAIGISFNAFLCVCVDAYVNGAGKPAPEASAPRAPTQSERRRARLDEAEFQAVADQAFDDNGQPIGYDEKWKLIYPDPEMWPWHDPEPAWDSRRDEILGQDGHDPSFEQIERHTRQLEAEYWATRERPAYAEPGRELAKGKRRGKRGG
ncbi:hypothetical protein [[Acidovorax] ebreus]|uniref:hypothetical protein n=1 Tax=[Acidovorax] ebreus TaxID=721785 RepID=UPI0005A2527C|nr:hypothetical protein [[Acidovorax] ebreus]